MAEGTATTEQIIVEFVVDDADIDKANKKLQNISKTDKADADILKQTNAELEKRGQLMQRAAADQKKVADGNKATVKSLADLDAATKKSIEAFIEGFLEQAQIEIENLSKEVDSLKKKNKGLADGTQTVKQRAKELTEQLIKLKLAGQDNTEEYRRLNSELGNIKDTMADVAAEAKTTGSDTRVFDGLISAASGLAGGFAAVQGSMALLGEEGGEVQEMLLKVNAAMAILQGLQSVQNTLQKESAASLLFLNNQRKVEVATTELATAAESKNVVVKNLSAAASRALAVAQSLANPITLAVVAAIVALTAAYKFFTKESKDAAEAQKLLNDQLEAAAAIAGELDAGLKAGGERAIAEMRERGATERQIREAELKNLYELRRDASQRELDLDARARAAIERRRTSTDEAEIKRLDETIKRFEDYQQKRQDLDTQIFIKEKENIVALRKEQEQAAKDKKTLDEQAAKDKKALDDKNRAEYLEAEQNRLKQIIDGFKLEQVNLNENTKKWKDLQVAINNTEAALANLTATGNTAQLNIALAADKNRQLLTQSVDQVESLVAKTPIVGQQVISATAAIAQAAATMTKSTIQQTTDDYDKFVKDVTEKAQLIANVYSQISNSIQSISAEQQKSNEIKIENQRKAVENELELGLITEAEAKRRNERIDREERKMKLRQAQRDKQLAIFNAIIGTAQAVVQALAVKPPLGFILAGIVGALGAAQIAAIAARPIPQFAKGKKNSYQGPGIAGEAGAELIEREDGRMEVVKKKSLVWLGRKDKVYTASETRRMVRDSPEMIDNATTLNNRSASVAESMIIDYDNVGRKIAKHLPQVGVNMDQDGFSISVKKGIDKITYLDKRRKF